MRSRTLSARWIRSLRAPKAPHDPSRAHGWQWEDERHPDGRLTPTLTIFLTGAECPFTCVFCDLWRWTTDQPTAAGAIPRQIDAVLAEAGDVPAGASVKLYNAGNFFDERAVPRADDAAIAEALVAFDRVVVENHPRLVDDRCPEFADRLRGDLEVAMGLESSDPGVFARLNKGCTLAEWDDAATYLRTRAILLRAFVLLAPPFLDGADPVEAVTASVRHALSAGARHVTIIPTRGGNGAMEVLRAEGAWQPPSLRNLEQAQEASVGLDGVVTVDLWDAERLPSCEQCRSSRLDRLERMNRSGTLVPSVTCACTGD